MDETLRDLCRSCAAGDDEKCFQAFLGYRRAGYTSQQMPREVLYGKTRHRLAHQIFLDFRDLLHRDVSRPIYSAIQFNDGVDISIQGHCGAYCEPREDLPDPRMYSELEFLFEIPVTQTILDLPDDLMGSLTPEELNDVQLLYNAIVNPLCKIRKNQVGNNTEIIIMQHNPDFVLGGIYYGFPHQDVISLYDHGAAPYVPIEKIQDVFDFLRARFGCQEKSNSRSLHKIFYHKCMNHCPTCNQLLKLLQLSMHDSGLAVPPQGSERTAEIRGCRKCDVTYYFGATRINQQEHWMKTPFKFNEFDRANEDWDQAWNNLDQNKD